MKRFLLLAFAVLAACGSAPQPVTTGPRLRAEPAASFRDDPGPGREAAFSADGRLLATTSASGLIVLRRIPDLKIVRRLRHPDGATAVAFAPDSSLLATAGYDGAVLLWDLATGKLRLEQARDVISGIAEGCRQAGCALVGGETAEMPGMYAAEDYDLAGFAVGAAERGALLPRGDVGPGDVLLGLASSGVHSNGFSLVRRAAEAGGARLDGDAPFAPGRTLAEALLEPTRIYVKPLLALHRAGLLKAAAHVTGGGLPGNVPRVLPEGVEAVLDAGAWPVPLVFGWLARTGGIAADEMLRVFNCGIGMVLAVAPGAAEEAAEILASGGETVFHVGRLEARSGAAGLRVEKLPADWPAAG